MGFSLGCLVSNGWRLFGKMLREVVEEIKSKSEAQVALEIASFGEDSASGAA